MSTDPKWKCRGLICSLGLLFSTHASALDPFFTEPDENQANSRNALTWECNFGDSLSTPLTMVEAIQRAICGNSDARHARNAVKNASAKLGVSETAWIPVVTVNPKYTFGKTHVQAPQDDYPSFEAPTVDREVAVKLDWLLYDFGARSGSDEAAREDLLSALANEDANLQKAVGDTAQAYYDASLAQGILDARLEQERNAADSVAVVEQRHHAGAATLAEELQAKTDYLKATSDRIKAEETQRTAESALAIAMGLRANASFVPEPFSSPFSTDIVTGELDSLLELVKRDHPLVKAAESDLAAAQARREAAESTGMPTISLVGNATRSYTRGDITIQGPAFQTDKSIGIELEIPFSAWIGREYVLKAAAANEQDKLIDLESQVSNVIFGLRSAYYLCKKANEELRAASSFLDYASKAFDVTRARYKAGSGTLLDLLTAQRALADAREQKIQATYDWFSARLKFFLALGTLSNDSLGRG